MRKLMIQRKGQRQKDLILKSPQVANMPCLTGVFRLVGVGMNPDLRCHVQISWIMPELKQLERPRYRKAFPYFPDFAMARSRFPLQRAVPIPNKPVEADRGCLSHWVVFVELVCAT